MGRKVLIVEGKDERILVEYLQSILGLEFEIIDAEGEDNINNQIKKFLTLSGDKIVSLGVLRDANNSPSSIFQGFIDCLRSIKNIEINIPEEIGIFPIGLPKAGIFILPGDSQPGHLEDLLLQTANQEIIECVDLFIKCIKSKDYKLEFKEHKARMKAYLAIMPKHEVSTARSGLKEKYFNLDSPQLGKLKSFLQDFTKK